MYKSRSMVIGLTMIVISKLVEEVCVAIINNSAKSITIDNDDYLVDSRICRTTIRDYEILRALSLALRQHKIKMYISDDGSPYTFRLVSSEIRTVFNYYHLPSEKSNRFNNPIADERSMLVASGKLK